MIIALATIWNIGFAQEVKQSSAMSWQEMHPERSNDDLKAYTAFLKEFYNWEVAVQKVFLLKGYAAAKQLKNDTTSYDLAYQLGNLQLSQDSFFSAATYFNEALTFQKDEDSKAMIYNMLGYTFSELQDYQTAIDYYFQAVDIREKDKPLSAAYSFVNISQVYMSLEDYASAIKYIRYAEGLAQQMEFPENQYIFTFLYTSLSTIYTELEQQDSSKYYVDLALQIIPKIDTIKSYKYDEAEKMIYVKAIEGYLDYEMSEAAYDYLQKVKTYNLTYYKNSVIVLEAKYNTQKGAYQKGLKLINSLKFEELDFPEKEEVLKLKIELYKNIGDKDPPLALYQELNQLQKEQLNTDRTRIATLADAKYETLKKNEAIKSLQLDQKVKDLALRNQQYILLLVGILAIFLLGIALYMRQRAKERKNLSEYLQQEVDTKTQNLQKVNEELRIMNYIASHDIKEPIRNIGSYVGLIKRRISDEAKTQLDDYFNIIQVNISNLYTLVEDIATYINLSKDEAIELEWVDMDELISNLFFSLDTYKTERNGILRNDGIQNMRTSSTMMFVILKNLVENGLKYNNSEVPMVTISYQNANSMHQISISDNGIGIEKQYHHKIFESFKRLHNRGDFKGSGIGLSIVKLLLEKLNGHIELQSEVGKGSTFILSFPSEKA